MQGFDGIQAMTTARARRIRQLVQEALAQSAKTGALISPGAFDRGVAFGATHVAELLISEIEERTRAANNALMGRKGK